jgi:hypothetical protein
LKAYSSAKLAVINGKNIPKILVDCFAAVVLPAGAVFLRTPLFGALQAQR